METMPEIEGLEIEEMIGQGGMATVWRGRQLTLDRAVAVKVLHTQWGSDAGDLDRFRTEARSAAKLKHPSIIQVHDANFLEGQYYIVMEFIDGYTVGEWLRRKGKLTQEDVLLVGECVADALAYAWENERIIHCDIKPDNVMIDRDGTVKVADLGLARTIGALRSDGDEDEEIMGTPAYMSPEQASGMVLDCRADIYSLGCMLYHMLTGAEPFAGEDVDTTLELHATGTVPDVLDVVDGVSKPVCALLQKMMAKERELRQADWQEVLHDIKLVRHFRMPSRMPPHDASTMACSAKRRGVDTGKHASTRSRKRNSRGGLFAVLLVIGAGVAFFGWRLLNQSGQDSGGVVVYPPDAGGGGAQEAPVALPVEDHARVLYEAAKLWAERNPRDLEGAGLRFRDIVVKYPESRYAGLARHEMRRLAELRQQAIDEVLSGLRAEASRHETNHAYDEAIAVFADYAGAYARETESGRQGEMSRIRQLQDAHNAALRAAEVARQEQVQGAWSGICIALLDDGLDAGLRAVEAVLGGEVQEEHLLAPFREVKAIFTEALLLNRRVLESFRVQRGQELDVALATGVKRLKIISVDDAAEMIEAEEPVMVRGRSVGRSIRFGLNDLVPAEFVRRTKGAHGLAVSLAQVIRVWSKDEPSELEKMLGGFPATFREVLLAEIRQRRDEAQLTAARAYLLAGLRWAGVDAAEGQTYAEWAQAVEKARASGKLHVEAPRLAADIANKYGETSVARDATVLLDALRGSAGGTGRSAEEGVRERPRHPRDEARRRRRELLLNAEEHIAANQPLVRALVGENPNVFDTDVRILRDPDTAEMIRIEVVSGMLSRIDSLRDQRSLEELVCAGAEPGHVWRKDSIAGLSDLSPLRGLSLSVLCVNNTSVLDLTPLAGMPLREFNAMHSKVIDISPLRNAPLEVLNLRGTGVRDISVLRGKPLEKCDLASTAVFDFRPVSGAPLAEFDAADSQFRDLFVLHGAPIRKLNVSGSKVYDFAVLREFPLEHLEVDRTQINDLSVLRGKALRTLSIRQTLVRDLSVLAGMPLRQLYMSDTPVADLGALVGLPLEDLDISKTRITDLGPLAQLPLRSLNLAGTRISDVEPLAGLQLRSLDIRNVPIRNYSPLAGMPLERISLDKVDAPEVQRFLRSLPNLRYVNGLEWWP